MEANIRKFQDILRCSGYAVILFGAWSIVRMFLLLVMDPLELETLLSEAGGNTELEVFALAVTAFFLGLDLLFRYLVGRAAIKESRGEKRKLTYVIFAAAYAGLSIWSDVAFMIRSLTESASLEMIGSVIVDLTTCVALVEIVVSSLKLRKLGRGQSV